jgi:uncharacterized membrane protein (UPF0136 family)
MINSITVLWVYIVFLLLGGLMGFLKAGSKMSLIMSAFFAAILILCNIWVITNPYVADFVLAFLLVFFTVRYFKSKKFMPNGLMSGLTLATLILKHLAFIERHLNLG